MVSSIIEYVTDDEPSAGVPAGGGNRPRPRRFAVTTGWWTGSALDRRDLPCLCVVSNAGSPYELRAISGLRSSMRPWPVRVMPNRR